MKMTCDICMQCSQYGCKLHTILSIRIVRKPNFESCIHLLRHRANTFLYGRYLTQSHLGRRLGFVGALCFLGQDILPRESSGS